MNPPAPAHRVLLLGASGLLGTHLAPALRAAGFEVSTTARGGAPASEASGADFSLDHDARTWLPRVTGMHTVINAVGIFAEQGRQTFRAIHVAAPRALFQACVQAGVRHVVQVSALGADSGITPYLRSKRQADEYLMALPLDWTILRPSLVYGEGGTSSRFFRMLASLPWIPLPGDGAQPVQPVHVDDVADAVVAVVARESGCGTVPLVGSEPITLRRYLVCLRMQLGLGAARCIAVPRALLRLAAQVGRLLPGSLLRPESLAMLERGSTADPAPVTQLLGRVPRPVRQFIAAQAAGALRQQARLCWLLPLLCVAMALLWVASAVVSLWVYPREAALELLAAVGLPAALRPPALYLASGADMLLGLACLLLARRPWVWLLQIALVLGYTLAISLWLPGFWAHPFGPLTKNIPLLAVLVLLYIRARDRWVT